MLYYGRRIRGLILWYLRESELVNSRFYSVIQFRSLFAEKVSESCDGILSIFHQLVFCPVSDVLVNDVMLCSDYNAFYLPSLLPETKVRMQSDVRHPHLLYNRPILPAKINNQHHESGFCFMTAMCVFWCAGQSIAVHRFTHFG